MEESKKQIKSRFIGLLGRIADDSSLDFSDSLKTKLFFLYHLFGNSTINSQEFRILQLIEKAYERYKSNPNRVTKTTLISYINNLYYLCFKISDPYNTDYNTEDYYKKTILELETKINGLNRVLEESKQSSEQKEEIKKELEVRTEQIRQITADKEELEKRLDAQENIKKKIIDAFEELKKHTSHLKKEKTRLNWMFYVYAFLGVLVLGLLIYFEFVYLSKWTSPTTLIDYLPFYIPVPIVGGLLWAFIYQMNRAQRQLMLVAYELYHVDYVEGLLLAINMVSPNVASATEKIGNVLDVLVKKHISIPDELLERSLDKEISKDNIDLNTFINIAKEVKGVLK